jgi:hypothetical protein
MTMLFRLLACVLLLQAACSVSRDVGDKPLGSCEYCVLSKDNAGDYYQTAKSILGRSFTVVDEDDPMLESPAVRRRACTATIDWRRGFWSTSGWVEIKDWKGEEILRSSVRRGAFWAGAHGDVMESLNDVAAARAQAGPVPPAELPPADNAPQTSVARTKAQRLTELNELRSQGLVSESEYARQRARILDD